MAKAKAVPEGYTTVTPSLIQRDCNKAIEFYKRALGAVEVMRMPGPDGKIMHAEIRIGNAVVMMNDEMMGMKSAESLGSSPVTFYIYVEDCDQAYQKAIAAGGKEVMPPADMFWGDRMSQFTDPFGYRWSISTHVKDMTPEEMKKGQEEWMKQMAGAH
ncbi:MAG TPA: VOC family protein [Candidatus Eisenbacteria bacterium]|nr:VOC family protein [Candidatus Eisenbacteria bacterium]